MKSYIYIPIEQFFVGRHDKFIENIIENFRVILSTEKHGFSLKSSKNIEYLEHIIPPLDKNELIKKFNNEIQKLADFLQVNASKIYRDVDSKSIWDVVNSLKHKFLYTLIRAKQFQNLTKIRNIGLVIVSAEYTYISRPIVIEAKKRDIPVMDIEHGFFAVRPNPQVFNNKEYHKQIWFISDYLIVDNKLEADLFNTYARESQQYCPTLLPLGTPIISPELNTILKKDAIKKLNLDPSKKTLGIFPSWAEPHSPLDIFKTQFEEARFFDFIFRAIKEYPNHSSLQKLVKLHPAIKSFGERSIINYILDRAASYGINDIQIYTDFLSEIMVASDYIISSASSSVLWEGLRNGKPVALKLSNSLLKAINKNMLNKFNNLTDCGLLHLIINKNDFCSFLDTYSEELRLKAFRKRIKSFMNKWEINPLSLEKKCLNIVNWIKTHFPETSCESFKVKGSNMNKSIFCSIIIPVFNKLEYTKQCLDALCKETPTDLFELIIVNNASTDGTKEFLNEFAKTYPNVKVIHNQENLGFAKACNQGARVAEGKYLVFLNNDTVPLYGWLEEMLKIIETEKNVGIVGSKLLYPDNTIQHAGVAIADFPQSIYPYHIHRKSPADALEVNVVKDYQAVTGACMLIPKEFFDRLGGFDEGFLNGYEDVDLCFRVREAGYRVVYTPKSVLYHFESISEGRFKAVNENEKRLQEKWAGKIEPDVKVNYPKVSIVILNYNGWWDTIKCLESVYKSNYKKYQVIVVDNGSKIDNIEKFKNWAHKTQKNYIHCEKNRFIYPKNKFDKELVTIINKENLGFAGGNNIGIRYALKCGADYIWLLNNDTIIDKDALIELIKLAEIDKKIGMVSSKLYCYHDPKKVQYNGEKVVYEGMEDVKGELPKPTNSATGCSLLMRRKFIENVGLLDEDYFLYFEDNDISTRALKAGWKVYYNPYSKVYHKGGASVGGWLKTPLSVYYATRNLLLYHHKHDSLKILEIFDYLKYQFFPQLNGDRKKIYAFSQGIEDFIFKKKGKTDIDFKNISEIIKKIEREKSEIEESLKNLSEIGTKEKFYLIKNAFILKSDEYLNKFFNLAQVLFLKESYKKDKKEVDYYHQAEALYDNGQETEAIKLFKKTLELNPNFALAHNDLAYIYWRKKEIQKALHHLTKAMELDPDNRDIIWNFGQIMLGLGYAKDAYKVYKSYLKRHPGEKEIRQVVEELEKGQIF